MVSLGNLAIGLGGAAQGYQDYQAQALAQQLRQAQVQQTLQALQQAQAQQQANTVVGPAWAAYNQTQPSAGLPPQGPPPPPGYAPGQITSTPLAPPAPRPPPLTAAGAGAPPPILPQQGMAPWLSAARPPPVAPPPPTGLTQQIRQQQAQDLLTKVQQTQQQPGGNGAAPPQQPSYRPPNAQDALTQQVPSSAYAGPSTTTSPADAQPLSNVTAGGGTDALVDRMIRAEGGSPAGVVNNPGNIKFVGSPGQADSGVRARDGGTYASYPTPQAGRAAVASLATRAASGTIPAYGRDPTVGSFINTYQGRDAHAHATLVSDMNARSTPDQQAAANYGAGNIASQMPDPRTAQVSLPRMMAAINQTCADCSPEVKSLVMSKLYSYLEPQAKEQFQNAFEVWKAKMEYGRPELDAPENYVTPGGQTVVGSLDKRTGRIINPQTGQPLPAGVTRQPLGGGGPMFQGNDGTWYRVDPKGNVSTVALPAGAHKPAPPTPPSQQLLPELKYPPKWDGMEAGRPPPGVREDIWDTTLFFARTHQMPALGFSSAMRPQIIQAYPAALHALGIDPRKAPDIAAEYAGERHGEIVAGGRAAQIGFGIREAQNAAPAVLAASRNVGRFQFPPANQFWNWLLEKGGNPEVVQLRAALNTYLNIYAATVSRTGRLTDSQQNHAYELLSMNFNQGQMEKGVEQLDYEMRLMQSAVDPTMQDITGLGQPPALRQPPPPLRSPQSTGTGGAPPPGIPPGSTDTGQTSKGRAVWKAPDGSLHVPDEP